MEYLRRGQFPALVADSSQELIATLRGELAQRVREVAELHAVILAQANALESSVTALSATVESGAGDLSSPGASTHAVTPVERTPRSWRTWIRRAARGG